MNVSMGANCTGEEHRRLRRLRRFSTCCSELQSVLRARVCELLIALYLVVMTICKCSVNTITSKSPPVVNITRDSIGP
jgi:hypothetical protein